MIKSSPSFVGRVLLAVVLMIGFYVLAVAICGGLFYIPYAEAVYAHRIHPKLALICIVAGLAILWSVVPRVDKFEAPGPELTREQQPRLFAEIETIAKSVQQEMPAEVFLVGDVNAWVAQRGGIMGIGSRRVMGLGLPLMHLLTRAQLRAVLAHEFGHYHGGDTKLGPWIYKTRGTIGRTLGALGGADGKGSLLQLPFLWYGKVFLRITHAISRRQEFVADDLAARVVGSQPLIHGLRTVHGAGPAFQLYWANECAPVLNAGYKPPLTEGFRRFIGAERISGLISKHLEEELKTGKTDPYDTHPPLKERILAVEHLPAGELADGDTPATSLLDNIPALEAQLLSGIAGAQEAEKLKPIGWDDVCARIYLPQWQSLVEANAAALKDITPESLSKLATDPAAFGETLVTPSGQKPAGENLEGLTGATVGAALVRALIARGGKLESAPGQEITVTLGTATLEPFGVWKALVDRELTADAWEQRCRDFGILGIKLANESDVQQNKTVA